MPMFDVHGPDAGRLARARSRSASSRSASASSWRFPGVEYIYATAQTNGAFFIVRFKVGTNPDEAMTRVYTKTFANLDLLPPGAGQPLIKPRSIDDVPILALTLTGDGLTPLELRRAAAELRRVVSTVNDVADIEILGGRRRELSVQFDPAALARHRLSPLDLAGLLRASNARVPAGTRDAGGRAIKVEGDAFIRSAEDLRGVVLGVSERAARARRRRGESRRRPGRGRARGRGLRRRGARRRSFPRIPRSRFRSPSAAAPTRPRSAARRSRASRRPRKTLPAALAVAVTRDYGETAKNKSDELLFHMLLATLSVTALVALALGWREALVVLIAVPVTLALTLLVYWLLGYTLNRITLFALIFSIGILVDDAIVVVENIHRHFAMGDGRPLWKLAVDAVDEVGNPTMLATWAVIAAILPMAFVGGLMGPYMRPIPIGASFAMLFSAFIAFVVSPWAFVKILAFWKPAAAKSRNGGRRSRPTLPPHDGPPSRRPEDARLVSGRNDALLAASTALVPLRAVIIKMLPFDDKDDFEVVLNMPEGSSLEATRGCRRRAVRRPARASRDAARDRLPGHGRAVQLQRPRTSLLPEDEPRPGRPRRPTDAEGSSPTEPRDREVSARGGDRDRPPPRRARPGRGSPARTAGAVDFGFRDLRARRRRSARTSPRRLKTLLEKTPEITDVDTYVASPEPLERLVVEREKATLNGIAPAQVALASRLALAGETLDLAHMESELEPVELAKQQADLAEALGLYCDIGGSIESGIGNAANLHLGAATRIATLPSVCPTSKPAGAKGPAIAGCYYLDDVVTQPFRYENGAVLIPDGPGLGVEVDLDKLAKFAVK